MILKCRGSPFVLQITINWPDRWNTFLVHVDEQGTKVFCSGSDQALRSNDGYVDIKNFGGLNVLDLQVSIYRFSMADTSPLCYCLHLNSAP
jgi:hypothetical protein